MLPGRVIRYRFAVLDFDVKLSTNCRDSDSRETG